MDPTEAPFRLEPVLVEKPWGGSAFSRPQGATLPVGEAWIVSGLPEGPSPLADAPGLTLAQLVQLQRLAVLGERGADTFPGYPLLVKILDTADTLSVQVHPSDPCKSKTECWYVLSAEEGAKIYLGLAAGTTRDDVAEAVRAGTLPSLLTSYRAKAGDFYFVPPGTVHAVGAGLTLLEIQEPRNVTFRLYDWDRVDGEGKSRPLHVDQALDALETEPKGAGYRQPLPMVTRENYEEVLLVASFKFLVRRVRTQRDVRLKHDDETRVLVGLEGEGEIWVNGRSTARLAPLDAVVVPAASHPASVVPPEGGLTYIEARATALFEPEPGTETD